MNTYKADSHLVKINSQANEQANSALRQLSSQLTYMAPENVIHHTYIFLALCNMIKKEKNAL